MFKAMFYGLVTEPETMSFNRYCSYDFDDSSKKPVLELSSSHCG